MTERGNKDRQRSAASVAAAIRERIVNLESELAHWRQALQECEEAVQESSTVQDPPPTGAKPR